MVRDALPYIPTPRPCDLLALVVDDDQTARDLLCTHLHGVANVTAMTDGTSALRAYADAAALGTPFQLVCLDPGLPDMGGHEALERFADLRRQTGMDRPEGTRIVMTTSDGDPARIAGAFARRCDGYLIKPIGAAQVATLLATLRQARG
jgi:CheY-like chemotaxis protein